MKMRKSSVLRTGLLTGCLAVILALFARMPSLAAENTENMEAQGIRITLGDEVIVEDGQVVGAVPENVAWNSSLSTLALNHYNGLANGGYGDLFVENDGQSEFHLQLIGENTIGTCYYFASQDQGDMIITGDGTLNLTVPNEEGKGTMLYVDSSLTVQSGTIRVAGGDYGGEYLGIYVSGEEALFQNTEVTIDHTGEGILVDTGNLTIENSRMDIQVTQAPAIEVGRVSEVYGPEGPTGDVVVEGGTLSVRGSRIFTHVPMAGSQSAVSFYQMPEEDRSLLLCHTGTQEADTQVDFSDAFQLTEHPVYPEYSYYACTSPYLLLTAEETENVNGFGDVAASDWFYDAVMYVNDYGVMTGLNPTTFGPHEALARAQFAVIIHRLEGTEAVPYTSRFPDVAAGEWYTDAILWAADTGVVTGYSNTGMFGPADWINREQMAVMMYRYAAYKGYDTSARADISGYQDGANVSDFAREAMQWAAGEGIITGKYHETQLDPQGRALRSECATIMMRFIERYER